MSRRMLIGLLVTLLICCSFGNGMAPLLPVYALRVGASQAVAGWYTAFSFLCLAAGSLLAGRAGGFFQRRAFLVPFTVSAIPLTFLLGRVTAVWELFVVTGIDWLGGGCLLAGINIIASQHASEGERGRVFGLIGVVIGASSVVGGLGIGALVDRYGFAAMFAVVAGIYVLTPAALMLLPRVSVEPIALPPRAADSPLAAQRIGLAAFLVLAAQFSLCIVNGAGVLGRSLLMHAQGFPAAAITSTIVVGAIVVLPVPFVLGWLSDRVGRRAVLIACSACGAGALGLLAAADALWHFWIVGVLLSVLGVSISIGPAFIADLVPASRVGVAVSLFQAAFYLGSVASMSALVPAAEAIGMPGALAAVCAAAAISVVLLLLVRRPRAAAAPIVTPR